MKKTIALLIAAALSVLAAQAEKRVVISVNASVPIENQKWVDESDDERVQIRGLTFDFNLMTVRECGYSFIVGTGIGGAKTQSDSGILGETDLSGLSTKFKIGMGAAPINRENTVLAFHGFLGLNTKFLLGITNEPVFYDDIFCVNAVLVAGIDAVFVKRFSDTFGIFAGIDISTNLIGTMVYSPMEDEECITGTSSDIWGFGIAPGLVNVVPRFGISWLLD